MRRFQRVARFAAVLAVLAGTLGWQGLLVGGPTSAAAATATTLRGVDCHLSSEPSGAWAAVCPSSSTSIIICSLIPGYLRRWPAPHGRQWAVLDCPGPYPFGGLILMPDGHPPAGSVV